MSLWMNSGATLRKHLMMVVFANMCYVATDFKNKIFMKVATNNINIKIHQLFFKQRILGACVTIVQRKISVDLTRTS